MNLNRNKTIRSAYVITITVAIGTLLSSSVIYWLLDYGTSLFVIIPLMTGALPALLWGNSLPISGSDAFKLGFYAINILLLGFFVMGAEGLICIAMAVIPAYLMVLCGSTIGYWIHKRAGRKSPRIMWIFIMAVPSAHLAEQNLEAPLRPISTSVEINADVNTVWDLVVAFPQIPEPEDWLFRTGIAYPIHATISGEGVGAVRHCQFTTGPFVEPISAWEPPFRLAFDVTAQPAPMTELSFTEVDAPHLHDFFVSERGQFLLTELPEGRTRLEGTTWYRHNIRPAFYWQLWSDHIVHRIHLRVLEHIKTVAEESVVK